MQTDNKKKKIRHTEGKQNANSTLKNLSSRVYSSNIDFHIFFTKCGCVRKRRKK
jgi:hypothetical protein